MFPRRAIGAARRRTLIVGVALACAALGLTGCAPRTSPLNVQTLSPQRTQAPASPDAGDTSTDPTAAACTSFNASFVDYAQLVAASGDRDQFGDLGLALTRSTREARDAGADTNVVGALSGLSVLALSRSVGDGTVDSADEDNMTQAVLHSGAACNSAGVPISMG